MRTRTPKKFKALILYPSIFVAVGMALLYFVFIPLFPVINDYYFYQQKAVFDTYKTMLTLHIIGGTIALASGSLNLYLGLKGGHVKLHMLLGRIYAAAVILGSIAGAFMATKSYGGIVAHVGFFVLAVLWFATLMLALRAILILHDKRRHGYWMIINFSLTFAAVSLRIQIAPFGALPDLFPIAYAIIAWTCWVPNLLFALHFNRKRYK